MAVQLRAIDYKMDQLKTTPDEYLAPNSLNRDYTDVYSDDESMVGLMTAKIQDFDRTGIKPGSWSNLASW